MQNNSKYSPNYKKLGVSPSQVPSGFLSKIPALSTKLTKIPSPQINTVVIDDININKVIDNNEFVGEEAFQLFQDGEIIDQSMTNLQSSAPYSEMPSNTGMGGLLASELDTLSLTDNSYVLFINNFVYAVGNEEYIRSTSEKILIEMQDLKLSDICVLKKIQVKTGLFFK